MGWCGHGGVAGDKLAASQSLGSSAVEKGDGNRGIMGSGESTNGSGRVPRVQWR